jgi:hypothetical protein
MSFAVSLPHQRLFDPYRRESSFTYRSKLRHRFSHNHWLFDQPRLMYIHFESLENPIRFARKVKDALNVLTTKEVRL